jgi:hypothetical protein
MHACNEYPNSSYLCSSILHAEDSWDDLMMIGFVIIPAESIQVGMLAVPSMVMAVHSYGEFTGGYRVVNVPCPV